MRRYILLCLRFLLIAVLAYPVLVIIWGLTGANILYSNLNYAIDMDGQMYTRMQELKKTTNPDVLILGTSHAFRGIDTRRLDDAGISSFNLGSSSQSPLQTNVLMKRYLDQVKPKFVVYEVYPYYFTVDGVESALNIIATDKNDRYSFDMAMKINNIKVYNSLFYAYIRNFLHLDDNYNEPKVISDNTYIPGGFVERPVAYYTPRPQTERTLVYEQMQIDAFTEVLDMLKDRDIDYMLIFAPVTSGLYDCYTNMDDFNEMIKTYGNYYDFNKLMHLSDSLNFYDPDHLNQTGVNLFTNRLIEILQNNYGF